MNVLSKPCLVIAAKAEPISEIEEKFLKMSTCYCRLQVRIYPSIHVTTAVCKASWEKFFEIEAKCLETRFCLPGGSWWKSGWRIGWRLDQEKCIMGCGVL